MGNNKKYVVDANFIKEANNLKLTLSEFLLLLYFENADEATFDLDIIAKKLKIDKEEILNAFNSLLSKDIINLVSAKNDLGKRYDKVSLEGFYKGLQEAKKKEQRSRLKNDIFTKFQDEFKRPLHGSEIEIIKAWLEKNYDEELILKALEEAKYNDAISIRYIDTILYEWKRKGYKTVEDVEKSFRKERELRKLEDTTVLDYNWLDDYDK